MITGAIATPILLIKIRTNKEFNAIEIANEDDLPSGNISRDYAKYDFNLHVKSLDNITNINSVWTLVDTNCGNLLTLSKQGHFVLQTGLPSNNIDNYYYFNFQIEVSKWGYKNETVTKDFTFGIADGEFVDFTIGYDAHVELSLGYPDTSWAPTVTINPSSYEWISWKLIEDDDFNGKLSISTNGNVTLDSGLGVGDFNYKIKATAHKASYADKIATSAKITISIT